MSPNYPEKYGNPNSDDFFTCDWYIYAKPQHKVLMMLQEDFSVEGNPADRGCPAAVLRIWPGPESIPLELCGENLGPKTLQIISMGSLLRLSFTTAPKAVGAKGFKGIWTEIQASKFTFYFVITKTKRMPISWAFCLRYAQL